MEVNGDVPFCYLGGVDLVLDVEVMAGIYDGGDLKQDYSKVGCVMVATINNNYHGYDYRNMG